MERSPGQRDVPVVSIFILLVFFRVDSCFVN